MTFLLLATACFPTVTSTDTADTADSGDTDAQHTGGDTGAPPVVGTFEKYKTDSTASLRGVYSSGSGVYLAGSRGTAWVGSASDGFESFDLPGELAGVDLNDVWGAGKGSSLELVVPGDQGWVGIYADESWVAHMTGGRDNRAASATSASDVYVVGDNGVMYFDGASWSLIYDTEVELYDVCAYSGGAIVAGAEGTVLSCMSSSCSELDSGRSANFRGVACDDDGVGWVVGDQGQALSFDGDDFKSVGTKVDTTLNAVFMDGDEAIAVGNTGVALKYDGDDWLPMDVDTDQNLWGVHGVSATNAWTVGDGGVALQYKD